VDSDEVEYIPDHCPQCGRGKPEYWWLGEKEDGDVSFGWRYTCSKRHTDARVVSIEPKRVYDTSGRLVPRRKPPDDRL
jgi:hypothetical protein